MLTYDLSTEKRGGKPLYHYLYMCIKTDIEKGIIASGEKLPSKRSLAEHLNISIMTVQNAYAQLISEGYVYTVEKSGYFAAGIASFPHNKIPFDKSVISGHSLPQSAIANHQQATGKNLSGLSEETIETWDVDCTGHSGRLTGFPFSAWSKCMREVLRDNMDLLTSRLPHNGVFKLRKAICDFLFRFKGLDISPENIIICAGSEYIYSFLVKLLGRNNIFSLEEPGYKKINSIYNSENAKTVFVPLDDDGLSIDDLYASEANIAHVSPSHHFPTGIIMSASRRYELLKWANEADNRYIIEDDYDSEFRYQGKPVPTLISIDNSEKVIYMNTFSKTISPSLRISYVVLPSHLMKKCREQFNYLSCTVSAFEQYTLATFISNGDFERYLNRSVRNNRLIRNEVIKIFKDKFGDLIEISEKDSGLHFVIHFKNMPYDDLIKSAFKKAGINISCLSDYYYSKEKAPNGYGIINYSGIDTEKLKNAIAGIGT